MQKVEIYNDIIKAKRKMEDWIRSGWRVHTCTMSSYAIGYTHYENVLVVYEK